MSERETRFFPSWVERERASDLAWISKNLHVFWPVARQGHEEEERGAIVVDTTQRPTRQGHPLTDPTQAMVEQTADQDVQRMVREYDPSWQMVTVLLQTHDRTNIYRLEAILRKLQQ